MNKFKFDKEDLDLVLKNTSPHSFKHNVLCLCEARGLQVRTDPDPDVDSRDLVQKAIDLANAAIEARAAAAAHGIPLEEVQDVVAGVMLNTGSQDPDLVKAAVHAVLFGLDASTNSEIKEPVAEKRRKPRHPYENIVD